MLEQYTSLTFTGHTRGNAMEPFLWSGGPIGAPKGPQMAKNDNFGAIRGCCGSALAEQCGIKVEQVRAHPGRCNEPFLWSGARSLKSGLVLPTQIFGLFGPPKKRVNFDRFNQRQKCVFCVLNGSVYVSRHETCYVVIT